MLRESIASETWQTMIALAALALLMWAVAAWVASAPREVAVFTGHGMRFVRADQVAPLQTRHPP